MGIIYTNLERFTVILFFNFINPWYNYLLLTEIGEFKTGHINKFKVYIDQYIYFIFLRLD